ncbi:MAG TPA: glycosyltransferase family 39 protein [Gemmatimonadaceae bacterium]|nr:glycosyltransferase family 39 protein [Gemmatimonadaceae bacterium]
MTGILTKQPRSVGEEPAAATSSAIPTGSRRGPLLQLAPSDPDVSPRSFGAILAIVLVGALIVRLYDLGDGLWYDEIDTLVHYVRRPFTDLVSIFDNRNQHVLYSVLAHWSTGIFGESAWALRLPAALLGVASIGALAWFGAIVGSRAEALAASALLAFSYHHVWFSQNARGYTGLMLATLIASGLLVKMTTATTRRPGPAVAYAVTMALAVYIHMTAALIVIGHAIWWFGLVTLRREKPAWPEAWLPLIAFALSAVIGLLLYLPVLSQLVPTLLAPSVGGATAEWMNPLWFVAETIQGLARGLPGGWLTLGVAAIIGLCGLVSYARRTRALTALMLLPAIVTGAVMLVAGHNLWPRFFFFAAGFGALIVIRGVFVVAKILWPSRARALALGGAGLLVLASATTVPRAWQPKQDYLAARSFVDRTSRPGDAVVTVDMTEVPFIDYLGRPWMLALNREQLAAIETQHARTFVLLTFPVRVAAINPELLAHIRSNYTKAAEFPGTVAGGEIIVMTR